MGRNSGGVHGGGGGSYSQSQIESAIYDYVTATPPRLTGGSALLAVMCYHQTTWQI